MDPTHLARMMQYGTQVCDRAGGCGRGRRGRIVGEGGILREGDSKRKTARQAKDSRNVEVCAQQECGERTGPGSEAFDDEEVSFRQGNHWRGRNPAV
eukprot:754452-Hanusia_phi.AAC.23